MRLFQARDANVSIDLSGRQTGVSEQLLDEPQVSTLIEQVRGVAVADLVRAQVMGQPSQIEIALEHQLDTAHREAFAPVGDKYGIIWIASGLELLAKGFQAG